MCGMSIIFLEPDVKSCVENRINQSFLCQTTTNTWMNNLSFILGSGRLREKVSCWIHWPSKFFEAFSRPENVEARHKRESNKVCLPFFSKLYNETSFPYYMSQFLWCVSIKHKALMKMEHLVQYFPIYALSMKGWQNVLLSILSTSPTWELSDEEINNRRGLWHGDMLSPMLFIQVKDVLNLLENQADTAGDLPVLSARDWNTRSQFTQMTWFSSFAHWPQIWSSPRNYCISLGLPPS